MSENEFQDWLTYHCEAFPAVAAWLLKSPDTKQHWQRALADVDLDAAKQATDEMVRGDLDEPRGFSEHPRRIRRRAKEIQYKAGEQRDSRPKMIDGEPVYDCPLCCDQGTVNVVHPKTMRQVRDGIEFEDLHWYTCAVACVCERGAKWRREIALPSGRTRHALPAFDDTRMFRVDGLVTADDKWRFWEWIDQKSQQSQARPSQQGELQFV